MKPGHLRNPIVQEAHRMGILEQWKLDFKKGSRTKWQRTKWYGQNGMDKMVYGQNGIGQNGTDKMARIKYRG